MVNVTKYNAYAARQDANQPKKSDFFLLRYAGIRKVERQVCAEVKNGLLCDWARKLPFESDIYNGALASMRSLSQSRGQIRKATIDEAVKIASAEQFCINERIEFGKIGSVEGLLIVAKLLLDSEKLPCEAKTRKAADIMAFSRSWLASKPDDIRVAVKIGRFMREGHSEADKIDKAWNVIDMLRCWGHCPRSQAVAVAVLDFFMENGFQSYDAKNYIENSLSRFARGYDIEPVSNAAAK